MALAGHRGHYYRGTHHPPSRTILCSSDSHVDAACLASRRSFSWLALAGGQESSLLLCQLRS